MPQVLELHSARSYVGTNDNGELLCLRHDVRSEELLSKKLGAELVRKYEVGQKKMTIFRLVSLLVSQPSSRSRTEK